MGNDIIEGGDGNDLLYGGDASSNSGIDTLSYFQSTSGVTVDLAAGSATGNDIGTDVVSGFENVIGSLEADNITGDGGVNTLYGRNGNDVINGGGGR